MVKKFEHLTKDDLILHIKASKCPMLKDVNLKPMTLDHIKELLEKLECPELKKLRAMLK